MLRYFQHLDDMINVKRDVLFGMRVVDARFHQESQKWHVAMQEGTVMTSKFFIVAAGFASKPLVPIWDGIEQFGGELYHTYQWPSDVHLGRKRVALVGTGATGIQVAQQVAKEAASLTIFQRTPNFCLPMVQQKLDRKTQLQETGSLQQKLDYRLTTFSGHPESFVDRNARDDTPEEREAFFESLWRTGGFAFWIATYKDILFDREANRFAYDFWVKKTRARIQGREKQDILAPLDPPHAFGARRPCLEVDFYEQVSRSHVSLVDINKTPILRFVKEGILTADGTVHEFDVISIATGFDALTGSLLNMGLHTSKGLPLREKWAGGVSTYFGMTMAGCPNLFFLFSVHGPTASNGPACIELQGNWIAETLLKMRRDGVDSIEPTPEAERSWTKQIHETLEGTMIHETRSWYSGANNPGRKPEPLLFFGGFPSYQRQIYEALENDFRGFTKTFRHGK
jgi:cation diffusion facilitator CzcD-associated flavoprotein CzcO